VVLLAYTQAKAKVMDDGFVLHPWAPHVPKLTSQGWLPGFWARISNSQEKPRLLLQVVVTLEFFRFTPFPLVLDLPV
jgi:hypothetical protein